MDSVLILLALKYLKEKLKKIHELMIDIKQAHPSSLAENVEQTKDKVEKIYDNLLDRTD